MKSNFSHLRRLALVPLLFVCLVLKPAYAGLDVTSFLSASCLDFKVVGTCRYNTALVVQHWLPVAFIEVVRGHGDSVFSPKVTKNIAFASRLTGDYSGYEVRVWEITDLMRTTAFQAGSCAFCSTTQLKFRAKFESQFFRSGAEPSKSCGDTAIGKAIRTTKSQTSLMRSPLLYTTEMDVLSWRTGCRDKKTAYRSAFSCSSLAKGTEGVGDFLGLDQSNIFSSDATKEACIGSWGPVFPRQFLTMNSDVTGAAHAAYRAVHIASRTFGTASFPMRGAKMQLAYPNKSPCFKLGADAKELESKISASKNGVYGFVWWVRLACCKGIEEFASCSTASEAIGSVLASPIEGGVGNIPGLSDVPGLSDLPGVSP